MKNTLRFKKSYLYDIDKSMKYTQVKENRLMYNICYFFINKINDLT